MFSGQSASSIEEEANHALARVHCWGVRNKLSPSGQGDVGSESGGREDHIHYRNRANRAVRIVRLGTGDRKLGVRKMLDAVQRSVALKACRAHRTVSLHSALILSRLLPLDIRVREAAWLYEVKRGKDLGDTFVDRELERPVYFGDLLHPARVPEIGYESVENLDSQTVDRLAVVGPQIYTDGSRIEGKVGAALTEWRDGEETWCSTLRLDPFCTVFQAEMVALQRAIRRVKMEGLVNIFSDSKSSEVLTGPEDLSLSSSKLATSPRSLRRAGPCLFWVRAHAGIAGNERAELPPPLRRQRTMIGFRCRTLRFKLRDSPHCACDPVKIQDVLHVLEDCDMFFRERAALKQIGVAVSRRHFPEILDDARKRKILNIVQL
ncbi:hypothetical protein EVAR_50151_1 [Eumeta japonica]|uniref:Uncharacterized protein n=1 Tax=Eumeta variegata TaxID=151549 RepID=A0A4C1SIB2_EUMVA|nr:hypothetical protein EVAR_50151_1 [Eumeta japonica]